MDRKNKVREITQSNPEKAQQLIKGWIGEQE
jgi:flagellar biosynthesis/type III secretory pathway M-ring protein FliF/YscJ